MPQQSLPLGLSCGAASDGVAARAAVPSTFVESAIGLDV